MPVQSLTNIRKALSTLNPNQVRELSEKAVLVALHAGSEDAYRQMESFLLRDLRPARRKESASLITRGTGSFTGDAHQLDIYHENVPSPNGALIFRPERPLYVVEKTLTKYPDAGIALARSFYPFRRPYVHRVISKTSRDNTLFSITTALPDVIPNVIELPWAVAEFASDTAFLTMNQVRMAFLIAAASDREVGYMEQKSEIATVIGSAFGWRALARQVVGKVPFGGGLLGKAAIAYAGTKVLGLSLDHLYSIGFTYTRDERDRLYADAFRQGKKVAQRILSFLRPDLAAKFAEQSRRENTIEVRPS
ncbi:MAG: hypothetical protein JOY85_05085 [Acidobacteriaceae bacterium]|nr:hypothetical protein [Acidobacteriaceae bacterium]